MEAASRLFLGAKDTETETDALAAFGLELIDAGDEPEETEETTHLWAEHVTAVAIFRHLSTQWQVSFSGLVGMRYETIPFALELFEVPRTDWLRVVSDVKVLESATMNLIAETEA